MNFKHFTIILINLFSAFVRCTPIVGGERVPDNGWYSVLRECVINAKLSKMFDSDVTFSFAVSLQYKQFNATTGKYWHKHFCGGVLIQVYMGMALVVTASHCITPKM